MYLNIIYLTHRIYYAVIHKFICKFMYYKINKKSPHQFKIEIIIK